jgi:hypothetical protein
MESDILFRLIRFLLVNHDLQTDAELLGAVYSLDDIGILMSFMLRGLEPLTMQLGHVGIVCLSPSR